MYVSMKDMLLHAHRNNYAVMAINCVNMEQVKAVIESAEEEKSAVIINISPRQMKAHGYGYIMAPLIENLAKRASVPVAFNLDHGANFEDITAAMQYGFSSVMIDSSSYEFEENVRRTQQIASLAHGMGLSCEAELGHVGQAAQADDSNVDLYTNVKQAKEFVERTNCDCLAVAIGTAHGAYPKGMIPKLDFERLKELKAELDMPLVLHGGRRQRPYAARIRWAGRFPRFCRNACTPDGGDGRRRRTGGTAAGHPDGLCRQRRHRPGR